MKSEACTEFDQNSTWVLREPTLNEVDSEELSNSNASLARLIWSCEGPDVRAASSPMSFQSTREANSDLRSSSESPWEKVGLPKLKGLLKVLERTVSRGTQMKRIIIGSNVTGFKPRRTAISLSWRPKPSWRIFQPWKYAARHPEYPLNHQPNTLKQ